MGHGVDISAWRGQEAVAGLLRAPSSPEWPYLAPGRHDHLFSFLSAYSGRLPAPRWHRHASLGLLLLLRAEGFTVARLSFVSYISHNFSFFFPLWQIIRAQLILNFSLFAPAVELLARAKSDCSVFSW